MTNAEKIISTITAEQIADHIHKTYCNEGRCEDCPVHENCNNIFDKLGGERKVKSSQDVIMHWLNDYKDYIFYSHDSNKKKKIKSDYDFQYKFRCSCSVCRKRTNTYGLASIGISGANSGYRLLGKICEECFPKLCKVLNIENPNFKEPVWKKRKHNDSGKVYCTDCGKSSPPSYNFCPRCGEVLEK